MEFLVVVLVVVVVGALLALRVYRFFRRAATSGPRTSPACTASCPSCAEDKKSSSCSEAADVRKALVTNEPGQFD
jgi:hypothetical protein